MLHWLQPEKTRKNWCKRGAVCLSWAARKMHRVCETSEKIPLELKGLWA
jgi:hypothetical protein